jgi:hypothetical protein
MNKTDSGLALDLGHDQATSDFRANGLEATPDAGLWLETNRMYRMY